MRASLEVADVFRAAGPAYRAAHTGHLSLHQLKVMSAIEHCRTAALGGHVEACTDCGHWRIAYNSCRNRHCPKCQGAAARTWLEAREADLLPVGYFHVVFTLPAEIAAIALQNKATVYGLLFQAASETMTTIAADSRHLGPRVGIPAVLHSSGSAMTHHPHIHMIVPGGGIAPDGQRWISSRPAFLLPVRVLGKLFQRLFLTRLMALHEAGRLGFFGALTHLAERRAFLRHLAPVRKKNWAHLEHARRLLAVAPPVTADVPDDPDDFRPLCPCCGGHMVVIETFERWRQPRAPPRSRSCQARRPWEPQHIRPSAPPGITPQHRVRAPLRPGSARLPLLAAPAGSGRVFMLVDRRFLSRAGHADRREVGHSRNRKLLRRATALDEAVVIVRHQPRD